MKPGYPVTEMIMAETLVVYDALLKARDGNVYRARACGRGRDDGLWEGWIEFTSPDAPPLRTRRETTQPNRDDLEYWAQGITATYLEGALDRALGESPA